MGRASDGDYGTSTRAAGGGAGGLLHRTRKIIAQIIHLSQYYVAHDRLLLNGSELRNILIDGALQSHCDAHSLALRYLDSEHPQQHPM